MTIGWYLSRESWYNLPSVAPKTGLVLLEGVYLTWFSSSLIMYPTLLNVTSFTVLAL